LHLADLSVDRHLPTLGDVVRVALRHESGTQPLDVETADSVRDDPVHVARIAEGDHVARLGPKWADRAIHDHVADIDRRRHAAGDNGQGVVSRNMREPEAGEKGAADD
jgi:hypothetical protein